MARHLEAAGPANPLHRAKAPSPEVAARDEKADKRHEAAPGDIWQQAREFRREWRERRYRRLTARA